MTLVLGIETSCDETAVALVRRDPTSGRATVLAEELISQIDDHKAYGGVVPEIAARAHISHLDPLIRRLRDKSGVDLDNVDAIAATVGPGLVGGLMVGAMTGKALSFSLQKPFVAVNHLVGHALSPRIESPIAFPYLLLLVSGGHCQILRVAGPDSFERLGTTIDDAAGEAFDKVAKMMALGYPGGPAIEKLAKNGDATRFSFPRPFLNRHSCDFSFSGLKTAVRLALGEVASDNKALTEQDAADVAASFQAAVCDVLVGQMEKALVKSADKEALTGLVVAGGVAANQTIRSGLTALATRFDLPFVAPPLRLCTDNAVMIAWAALERLAVDPTLDEPDAEIRARWPLDPSAETLVGSGRKGAKS